ncbi:MAG: glycosyltransferase [Candidatus Omnitrophica bacterium]|nr:glycosyltransferase [Candidatus Omnitrophota bacterium]
MVLNKRIKILHIIESIARGGAEYNLLNVLKCIDKDIFYNKILYLYKKDDLSEDFKNAGIDVECIGMKDVYDFKKGLSSIMKNIRRHNYDMIHTQLFGSNIYGRTAAFFTHKPVITTLQNPDYTFEGNLFRKILDKITAFIANTKFIAVSEFVKESFVNKLSLHPENIEIINNSLDLEKFRSVDEDVKGIKKNMLGLRQYILTIGRLHPQKGHIYLIKAFKRLTEKINDIDLVFIGEGLLKDSLISLVKELGIENRVHFLGIIKDVLPYLKRASIFAFPSLYEGLPLALLEAMAAGVPCVASDIAPIKEIKQNTTAIFLVKPGDISSLEKALFNLLNNEGLRKEMTQAAFKIVSERFDARKNSAKLEAYFTRVVDKT